MRDASGIDDMAKKAEIDQIEAHRGIPNLRDSRSQDTSNPHGFEAFQGVSFVAGEVKRSRKFVSLNAVMNSR
jgi:hypothetical protein